MAFIGSPYNTSLVNPQASDKLNSPDHAGQHVEINRVLNDLIDCTPIQPPGTNPELYTLKGDGWQVDSLGAVKGFEALAVSFAPANTNVWEDVSLDLTGTPGDGNVMLVESFGQCISGGGQVEIRNFLTTTSTVIGEASGIVPGASVGQGIVSLYASDLFIAANGNPHTVKVQIRHQSPNTSNQILAAKSWLRVTHVGNITTLTTNSWT